MNDKHKIVNLRSRKSVSMEVREKQCKVYSTMDSDFFWFKENGTIIMSKEYF